MVQYTRYKTTSVVKRNVEVGATENCNNEDRCSTDEFFIILPIFIFLIWLGIGIHVICNQPNEAEIAWHIKEENELTFRTNQYYRVFFDNYTRIMNKTSHIMLYYSTNIPVLMILSALSMYMYICFLERLGAKFFVHVSLVFMVIFILSMILNMRHDLWDLYYGPAQFEIGLWILIKLANLLYIATVIYCTFSARINNVAEVVKNSCRSIAHHPGLLMFAFVINIFAVFVLSFSVIVFNKLLLLNDTESLVMVLQCTNIFGGIFMFNFLINFGIAVIAKEATHSYQHPEIKVKSTTILSNIKRTTRYHLGTISFVSTLILPWIYTFVIACVHKVKVSETSENIFIKFFGKVAAICYMPNFSLILTSIYGYDFKNASRTVFDLIPGNSALYISAIEVSNFIRNIAESLIFFVLFTILHFTIYYDYSHISEYDTICSTIVIVLTIMSVTLTYHLLLKTIVYTLITHEMSTNIKKTVDFIQ